MSTPPHHDPDDDEQDNNSMYPLSRPFRPVIPPTSPSPRPLHWTRQLRVTTLPNDTSDRVLLPPSALEQLLASAPHNTDLPQPLTFRLFNPRNNHSTHVGVREFSAPDATIALPSWIASALDLTDQDTVGVQFRTLLKATRVKLRPLEAGYLEDDWKALLESQLRTHTTLTKGEILAIRAGPGTTFKFLVDELEPEDAVNLIDTDVTTEIEEMSEDNARKTQDQRIRVAKQRQAEVTDVNTNSPVEGTVGPGEYVYFRVKQWDRQQIMEVVLWSEEGDADLLISTSEDWKPKIDMHIWSNRTEDSMKRISLASTNIELAHADALQIGVYGNEESTFTLTVQQGDLMDVDDAKPNAHAHGFTQCQNCLSWVPERSLILHQNFCLRNNFRCQQCGTVVPKKEQSEHWHCPDCEAHGNHASSLAKHSSIEHSPQDCVCGQSFRSLSSLAFHRATSCPAKLIKCRFCQTFKEQGDLSTLSASDMLAGLTPHEAECGSRTIECNICGRRLRIKELAIHQRIHDDERKARPEPRNCRNINCTRARGDNPLGLCTICFGPLYSPLHDPGYRRLQSRLERKLLTQLMSGCGQTHCSNTPYCATAIGRNVGMAEAIKVIQAQVSGMLREDVQFHICVDEVVQRKAFLAGMISAEGVYSMEWARKAVEDARGDLSKARAWLEQNARRLDE
jgi:Ubiquitin fusion degradation protein UFD1